MSGEKVVIILGDGKGAVAKASLVGISSRVRDQFLFLISGIVLLTYAGQCHDGWSFGQLALGLTKLPAVKKVDVLKCFRKCGRRL